MSKQKEKLQNQLIPHSIKSISLRDIDKVKQQTIKSLSKSWIYKDCKPNYVNEEETFSIYDLGNVDVFSKLYKCYRYLKFCGKKKPYVSRQSILNNFEFGREDGEIYSYIDKLKINEVFDIIEILGNESYLIQNSNSDCVCEYFEKYKSFFL